MKTGNIFSIRMKIITAFVLAGFIALSLLGGIIYGVVLRFENDKINEKLRTAATYVAETIDGDILQSLKKGDDNTEAYLKMLKEFRNYKKIADLTFVYTVRPDTKDTVTYIVDAGEAEGHSMIGDVDESLLEIRQAFEGIISVTKEPVYSNNGEHCFPGMHRLKTIMGKLLLRWALISL